MIGLLRWVRRHLGLAGELAAYAFWLLLDLIVSLTQDSVLNLLAGTAVASIVLARRRPGVRLTVVAWAAIGVSAGLSLYSGGSPLAAFVAALYSDGQSTGVSLTEQLALAILVVEVLRRVPLRSALVITAAAAVAIVGSPVWRSGQSLVGLLTVLSALGWGGAVAVGLVLREVDTRRRAALEDVRSAERMELARELHDVVAHHVTGIVVAAQAAAVVARRSPDEVDRALAAIETAGTDALAAMRRMVGVLRGHDSDGARTPGADLREVRTLVERFDPGERLVRLSTDPGLEHAVLPAGVAVTGYRVVQEALTNVRRHAPEAAAVEVEVRIRGEALLVSVRNDGVPAVPAIPRSAPNRFGLAGMSERVAALDGTLTAGPSGPGVWTVAARLPLAGPR